MLWAGQLLNIDHESFVFAGVFRGNKAQVKEYQDLLEPIIFQSFEGESSLLLFPYKKKRKRGVRGRER